MRKTKKKLRLWPYAIILGCAALAISYFFWSPGDKTQPDTGKKPDTVSEQKTDDRKPDSADFRAASLAVQAQVDKLLTAKKDWNVKDPGKTAQQVKRAGDKGTIDWWQRNLELTVDKKTTADQLKEYFNNGLKGKAVVLRQESDTYAGKTVTRFDIALVDKLGGDTLKLVTDRIYVIGLAPAVKKLGSGKLAIVIDDCGYDTDTVSTMSALKQKLTFAILPGRPFSKECLGIIKRNGQQAMLHLPMEPLDASQQSETRTVTVGMTDEQIKEMTSWAIGQVPGISGVNNHQGSRATADERVMRAALSVIKSQGLFFVDSNTQPKTVAYRTAKSMGVRTAINNAFLDGQADVEYIKGRMRQAGQAAIKNGSYIAICHARPKTVTALTQMVSELEEMGVQFVFVSSLLN